MFFAGIYGLNSLRVNVEKKIQKLEKPFEDYSFFQKIKEELKQGLCF